MSRPRIRNVVAFLFAALLPAFAAAEPAVPAELKSWQDWALHGSESVRCPFFAADINQRQCAWPGRLELVVAGDGARFAFDVRVYADATVMLPGDAAHWPQDVYAGNKALVVVAKDGVPQTRLAVGTYRISGVLGWERRPESLRLGVASGLVSLTLDGAAQSALVDEQGVLWFGRKQAAPAAGTRNTVATRVFRQLADGVPLLLTTRVELDVAGDDREIVMGRALPEGFAPVALTGSVPARLEKNGDLRLQVRAGHWVVLLEARQQAVTQAYRIEPRAAAAVVTGNVVDAAWPQQEIWVFLADHRLRTVRLEGAPTVDPRQTGLPEEWQSLPAYALAPGATLALVEQVRGDANPQPEPLQLAREFWLDFDGSALTARDRIAGTLERSGRLAFADGVQPGRVTLNGEPQVITALPAAVGAKSAATQAGIEVRPGALAVEAVSRISLDGDVPATGWSRDMQQLGATLQLPPGWTLFAATGVDNASPSWVSGWTLWDIFLVLVLTVAVYRMTDLWLGVLTLATLLLTHDVSGAPVLLWLNLVAVLAVWRVLPEGRLRAAVGVYRLLSLTVLAVVALLFAVDQVRQGIYPELEYGWRNIHQPAVPAQAFGGMESQAEAPAVAADQAVLAEGAMQETEQVRALAKSAVRANVAAMLGSSVAPAERAYEQVDPGARVQTGPGVPDWSWRAVTLRWDGPVAQTQRFDLWLVSPPVNRLLCFLRVALVALLLVSVWRGGLPAIRLPTRATASNAGALGITLLLGALAFLPMPAHADYPDATLLGELRSRLTAAPDCLPACAAIERAQIDADGERIALRLRIAAATRVAVPLPATGNAWHARSVLVDGKPAALARNGVRLAVALEPGVHDVVVEGAASGVDLLQFAFELLPGRVTANVRGWQVGGIVDGQLPGGSLDLRRDAAAQRSAERRGAAPDKRLLNDTEPAFVTVERVLRFDIEWHVDTHVVRVAPRSAPLTVAVPLLAGESVTSRVNVKDGKVIVALAQDQADYSWSAVLKPVPSLQLVAGKETAWVERWYLDASTRWHVDAGGVPPVKGAGGTTWFPWPGETLSLAISRPQAVAGDTLTVEQVKLRHEPGHRAATSTLSLQLLSSEGGEYRFRLPTGVVLDSIFVDGAAQVIAGDGSEAVIPLHPGAQQVQVIWRSDEDMGVLARTPALDFGRGVTNVDVELAVPADRWPLFTGGPGAGPAVLYWGVLVVVLLVAFALGRVPLSPLRSYEWALLGIGMSSTMLPWTALVVAWFFALAARARARPDAINAGVFNFLQVMLALFTLAAMAVLLTTIPQSLVLGTPDMQIAGNGSQAGLLHWFVDRIAGPLPQGWLVSLPMWAYRVAMLAWSLWLALALTRWLRWAWQCYSTEGLWRSEPAPVAGDRAYMADEAAVAEEKPADTGSTGDDK